MNPVSSNVGIPELIMIITVIGMVLCVIGLWIWSLIHCIKNTRLSDTNRIIGIVLIVVLGIFGSFIYLFLPRDSVSNGQP